MEVDNDICFFLKSLPSSSKTLQCYLCNSYVGQGNTWLLFEDRLQADGQPESPLSYVLGVALNQELEEDKAHSKIVCEKCRDMLIEFQQVFQKYCSLRVDIIRRFNNMAKCNGLPTIAVEIDGVLQADSDVDDSEEKGVLNELFEYEDAAEKPDTSQLELVRKPLLPNAQDFYVLINETPGVQYDIVDKELQDINTELGSIVSAVDVENANVENLIENDIENANAENLIENDNSIIIAEDEASSPGNSQNKTAELIEQPPELDESNCSEYESIDVGSEYEDVEFDEQTSAPTEIACDNYDSNTDTISQGDSIIIAPTPMQMLLPTKRTTKLKPIKQKDGCIFEKKENNYRCMLCPSDSITFDPKDFELHLRNVHYLRFYVCAECGEGFVSRQDLNDHKDTCTYHDKTTGQFKCLYCERSFISYRLLRQHKRMHLASSKPYECQICNRKYSSKKVLEEHINVHTGERPYRCAQCPKGFASKYTLEAHIKTHSERDRPHKCNQCGKSFIHAHNLTQHLKIHTGIKEFECEICAKCFNTHHNLVGHMIVHTGEKPFKCCYCGKAFARRAEIQDHERTHTGERPFKCDLCDLAFAQRSNLTSHRRYTHLNEQHYECEDCGRKFKRRRLLDYHKHSAHTGERPYVCEICAASFIYPEHHKKHMFIHTGKKPYQCEVCGKRFSSRDNRNAHRFTHSDRKPYECLECHASFMRKPQLLAHMEQTQHANNTIIINQPKVEMLNDMISMSRKREQEEKQELQDVDIVGTDVDEDDVVDGNLSKYIVELPNDNSSSELPEQELETQLELNPEDLVINEDDEGVGKSLQVFEVLSELFDDNKYLQ